MGIDKTEDTARSTPRSSAISWPSLFRLIILVIALAVLPGCGGAYPTAEADRNPLRHELSCRPNRCHAEARNICLLRHDTIRYRVIGQSSAGIVVICQP